VSVVKDRKRPSLGLLQSRLAALAHRRQAELLVKVQRSADKIRDDYRKAAGALAQEAAALGLRGLSALQDRVAWLFAQARIKVQADLERIAVMGYDTAADAVIEAIPPAWLGFFLGLAAQMAKVPIQEAGAAPLPEPLEMEYLWAPVAAGGLTGDEARSMVRRLLFPPPDEATVHRWLVQAVPGGLSWDQRLRYWEQPARAAMLNVLTQGLAAGENVDQLRARLIPFADGLAWKAQRIARTEGCRLAERAGRAAYGRLGDMLDGLQIVAVMDEWTRPHHAARNGRIYYRGPDGVYRDRQGQVLPDLPDEPNCRCMTIPVLHMPDVLKDNPQALAAFETATKGLIPDPASYADWWRQASERERMTAVGVRRYQIMRDKLAGLPAPRTPEWQDFIDHEGRLIPPEKLQAESAEQRAERRRRVDLVLAQREKLFRQATGTGFTQPGKTPVEQAVLRLDQVRLQQEIAGRLAIYRRHFRIPEEERRRQRHFQKQEHSPEEIREEILRRKRLWEERERASPVVSMEDLPPQHQRDLRERLDVIQQRLKEQRKEHYRSALYLPETMQSRIEFQGEELTAKLAARSDLAATFLSRIVHRRVLKEAEIEVTIGKDTRMKGAMYDRARKRIIALRNSRVPNLVHEMGHDLAVRLPKLDEAARAWRKEVTKGGELRTGSTKDSLDRTWRYRRRTDGVEQVTSHDEYLTREDPDRTRHEVISVGLQKLYSEPERTAEEDPTLFRLLLRGLRS